MLVLLAAEWLAGSVLRRRLGKRQGHSTIGVSWSDHERRTLPQGVDQEAAGGVVTVHRRERAVRCSQNRIRREWGSRVSQRTWGRACGLNLHPDASATTCLFNRRGSGQSETRRRAKLVDTGAIQVNEIRHFSSRHERASRRLMTKPMPRPKIEQCMNIMGYEFAEQCFEACRSTWYEIGGKFDELGAATAN